MKAYTFKVLLSDGRVIYETVDASSIMMASIRLAECIKDDYGLVAVSSTLFSITN